MRASPDDIDRRRGVHPQHHLTATPLLAYPRLDHHRQRRQHVSSIFVEASLRNYQSPTPLGHKRFPDHRLPDIPPSRISASPGGRLPGAFEHHIFRVSSQAAKTLLMTGEPQWRCRSSFASHHRSLPSAGSHADFLLCVGQELPTMLVFSPHCPVVGKPRIRILPLDRLGVVWRAAVLHQVGTHATTAMASNHETINDVNWTSHHRNGYTAEQSQ